MKDVKDTNKILKPVSENNGIEKSPAIVDEHFVPQQGLDLQIYIKEGNVAGVHHLIRYSWALKIIDDLQPIENILDIACGSGYGSYLIAKQFPHIKVVGSDYDHAAIRDARKSYALANLEYKVGDLTRWEETIGKTIFDCVISFDTIEHVLHREIMMENMLEHLQTHGSLLLSTPCGSMITNLQPEWEHHKLEYSAASLYDFLRRYFNVILRPDDNSLPHRNIFDILQGTTIDYLLIMNPVLCKSPILIDNPYKHSER